MLVNVRYNDNPSKVICQLTSQDKEVSETESTWGCAPPYLGRTHISKGLPRITAFFNGEDYSDTKISVQTGTYPNPTSKELTKSSPDTDAHTYSSGHKILEILKGLIQDLIPQNHKICGITEDSINNTPPRVYYLYMFALAQKKQSKSCIISYNIHQVCLSESVLKDLDLIPPNFTNPVS